MDVSPPIGQSEAVPRAVEAKSGAKNRDRVNIVGDILGAFARDSTAAAAQQRADSSDEADQSLTFEIQAWRGQVILSIKIRHSWKMCPHQERRYLTSSRSILLPIPALAKIISASPIGPLHRTGEVVRAMVH